MKRRRKMKKLIALLMAIAILSTITVPAQAASVPAKVYKAAENCINENNRCIVVDNAAGKMYLLKKCKGKWEVKKSFKCTVGDYINPRKHYYLLRNKDTDKLAYKEGAKTFWYGMYIDCYEEAPIRTMRIHSYGEKGGRTYKTVRHNPNGIGCCIDNAYHIWKYYGNGTAIMGV